MYRSQQLSYKFAVVAFLFFGLQAVVATAGGALELSFPDFNSPIPFTAGRSFHLNISIFWPLIGMMGAVYFFFCQEAEREVHSRRLLNLNFWLILITTCLILGSLLLGFNDGREYLEAVWPLKVAVLLSTLLLFYNLLRTYLASTAPKDRATLVSMLAGSFTLIIFYVPNIISYAHPTADEIAKFLVVHLWEEMTLELLGTGVLAAVLMQLNGAERRLTESAIYLDMVFVASAGIFATGHHYYWIGVPKLWLWIGGAFSALQVLPAILLLYAAFTAAKFSNFSNLAYQEKITMILIGCSMFYHIFGASFMGFLMAFPPINRYLHGTYFTSAHSHLALFGVFGFLVLSVCFHILFTEINLTQKLYRWCLLAIIALNAGLLTMGMALMVAGGLQAYLWWVVGLSVGETNLLLRPYQFLRMFGGAIYTVGSTILTFVVIKSTWTNMIFIFFNKGQFNSRYKELRRIQKLWQCLLQKQTEAQALLQKINLLWKQLLLSGKKTKL